MTRYKPTTVILIIWILTITLAIQLARPTNATEIKYEGDEKRSHVVSPLPYTYLEEDALPKSFDWGRVDGGRRSLLTHTLNQHIPQVCLSRCVLSQLFISRLLTIFHTTIFFLHYASFLPFLNYSISIVDPAGHIVACQLLPIV